MRHFTILSFLFQFVISYNSYAQITFQKAYRVSGNNIGYEVKQTLDGGYVVAGEMAYSTGGISGASILKLDAIGDTMWSKVYGNVGQAGDFFSIMQIMDGSYLACGRISDSSGYYSNVLIKTDSNGNLLWIKSYSGVGLGLGYESFNILRQTSDNGYMLAGHNSISNLVLLKTDSSGVPIFCKTYSTPDPIDPGRIYAEQINNGGFVLVSTVRDIVLNQNDIYAIKTDSLGNQIWSKKYGGPNEDFGMSIQQTPDDNFVILGHTFSFGAGLRDIYLIKVDSQGDVLWSKTYGNSRNQFAISLLQTNSNELILYGVTDSSNSVVPVSDISFYIKTDMNGDTLWTRTFDDNSFFNISAQNIASTSDNGFVMTQSTQLLGTWRSISLMKFDSLGNSVNCYQKNIGTLIGNPTTISDTTGTTISTTATFVTANITTNSISPNIYVLCNTTGLPESENTNLMIKPNPFTNTLSINFDVKGSKEILINVVNVLGQAVYTEKVINPETNSILLDLAFLESGVYWIEIDADGSRNVQKIVKQ